jgi:NAD(P)-dependent dehydrogenase (short-subunit alcohol dehydrogenase family)
MKGLTALITGGSSGIGLATAKLFLEEGANVVVVGRQLSKVRAAGQLLDQYKDRAHFITGDVSSEGYANKIVVDTKRKFGALNILVNCAGVFTGGGILSMSEEDFDYVVDVNLKGTWFMCKFATRIMLEGGGGAIVNISSSMAKEGPHGLACSAYSAAKGGILGLTYALAAELAPNVRVNCVVPGIIRAPMMDMMISGNVEQFFEEQPECTKIPTVEDVARTILFLSNPHSEWMTGHEITVGGAN